jgi:hypothetical protein
LRNAEEEVGRAEKRLKLALTRLREFRDKEGIIDPRKTADATVALAGRVRDGQVLRSVQALTPAFRGSHKSRRGASGLYNGPFLDSEPYNFNELCGIEIRA